MLNGPLGGGMGVIVLIPACNRNEATHGISSVAESRRQWTERTLPLKATFQIVEGFRLDNTS